jgi:hypothetical protein
VRRFQSEQGFDEAARIYTDAGKLRIGAVGGIKGYRGHFSSESCGFFAWEVRL